MRNLLLSLIAIAAIGCGKKEELHEVDVPTLAIDNSQERYNRIKPSDVKAKDGVFRMPGLDYQYADLMPNMNPQTLELQYAKIHLKYTDNLNIAVKGTPMEAQSIEEILASLDIENTFLRNNAGGYYNHNLFWSILSPEGNNQPSGAIAGLIQRDFGSFDQFKTQFASKAKNILGSGWVWVILKKNGSIAITTTPNEDNPLMPDTTEQGFPLLNLDMWEHAYYLQYKNDKQGYIDSFFQIIDWDKVNYRLDLSRF
ncbi:MAG TPA: superoxide dismutase [Flavobacterium sp.]|nr:superoxide dismutase [Flavobacterium sp.]